MKGIFPEVPFVFPDIAPHKKSDTADEDQRDQRQADDPIAVISGER